MVDFEVGPFRRDPRGNRLESWQVVDRGDGGHLLWLRGTEEMAQQVKAVAVDYNNAVMPPSPAAPFWTHILTSPSRLRSDVVELLNLLEEVITLPALPAVDAAIVLDWYKIPVDGVDPYMWDNSVTGDLVSQGKYRYKFRFDDQTRVGRELMGRHMVPLIARHPLLTTATIVLDIPSHDRRYGLSFGSRMAATVARDTGAVYVAVSSRDDFRPQAKDLDPANRIEVLRDQFSMSCDLTGRPVLIVDDVFRSGDSMRFVASAARKAGAAHVYGACAVRTLHR